MSVAVSGIAERIKAIVSSSDVVLFMKGTRHAPLCGYSHSVVEVLKKLDVDFRDLNVLEDQELREGIKEYSDWPTIPQLYVKGEFVGGCDIVKQMHADGSLVALLRESGLK